MEDPSSPQHACRICWSSSLPTMVSPCLCKGSARVVHLACLKRWAVSNLALWGQRWWLRCPTCKADYTLDVSLDLAQALSGAATRRVGHGAQHVATHYIQSGRIAQAEGPLRFIHIQRLQDYGACHPHTLTALRRLTQLLLRQGKVHEVQLLFRHTGGADSYSPFLCPSSTVGPAACRPSTAPATLRPSRAHLAGTTPHPPPPPLPSATATRSVQAPEAVRASRGTQTRSTFARPVYEPRPSALAVWR